MNVSFEKPQKSVSQPSPHCLEYNADDSFMLCYEAPEVVTSLKTSKYTQRDRWAWVGTCTKFSSSLKDGWINNMYDYNKIQAQGALSTQGDLRSHQFELMEEH